MAIHEFDAGDVGLRPSEVGIEAVAGAARRVNAAYNEAADLKRQNGRNFQTDIAAAGEVATDFIAHQELSHASNTFSAIRLGLTKEWSNISAQADPNDPTVAQRFLQERVQPSLEQFQGGFLTEKARTWAESHVQQFQDHMATKAASDMSRAASHAIGIQTQQTLNNHISEVYLDPSSLDNAMKSWSSSTGAVVGTSPTLQDKVGVRGELQEKGNEQLVKTAVKGYIAKTGEVPAWSHDPKYSKYIDAAEIDQFQKAARTQQRLDQAAERADRQQRDYENHKDFDSQIEHLRAQTFPKKVGDPPQLPPDYWDVLRDLTNHPGAHSGQITSMESNGNAITARLNKPDPLGPISHDTTMRMIRDMRNGRMKTENPIYDAYEEGSLNRADFSFMLDQYEKAKTPQGQSLDRDRTEFWKRYAPSIDGGLQFGEHSALGNQQMYAAEMDARRQEEMLRSDGKDPHSVYDPRSPDFFGKPENLRKYSKSLQEVQEYDKRRNEEIKAPKPETVKEAPPAGHPDAVRGPGGHWYVQRNGQWFQVVQESKPAVSAKPVVPMSR